MINMIITILLISLVIHSQASNSLLHHAHSTQFSESCIQNIPKYGLITAETPQCAEK